MMENKFFGFQLLRFIVMFINAVCVSFLVFEMIIGISTLLQPNDSCVIRLDVLIH